MIRRSFVLSASCVALLPTQGHAADTVSGRYAGNGKEVKLGFASAWPRDKFSDKDTIVIVLTEQDHSASKKPWFDAVFKKFGATLQFTLTLPDAKLVGSEVGHPGLKRSPVSVSGSSIQAEGVTITANRVEGRFFTPKPGTFFDDVFEFDIKVAADIRPRPA